MKPLAVTILLGLLLLWRGGEACVSFVDEVRSAGWATLEDSVSMSEDQRLQWELAKLERAAGKAEGYYWEIFTALRRNAPEDAIVVFVLANALEMGTATQMTVLLSPRRCYAVNALPAKWRDFASAWRARMFVAWCGVTPDAKLAGSFTERSRSDSLVLWQYRGE